MAVLRRLVKPLTLQFSRAYALMAERERSFGSVGILLKSQKNISELKVASTYPGTYPKSLQKLK